MSYGSVDGLESLAQIAHVEDSLAIQRLTRTVNANPTGVCEECDEDIPAARLKAIPMAKCCVKCQEALDRSPLFKLTHSNPYVP